MKKTIIGAIVLILLLFIGGIILVTTSRKNQLPIEPATMQSSVKETDLGTALSQNSSAEINSQNQTVKTGNSLTKTLTRVQSKVSVSPEEKAACIRFEQLHGYVADGICNEKPFTQEYLAYNPATQVDVCGNILGIQITVPAGMRIQNGLCVTSSVTQPTQLATKTYVNNTYGFSVKYPSNFSYTESKNGLNGLSVAFVMASAFCGTSEGPNCNRVGSTLIIEPDGGSSAARLENRNRFISNQNLIIMGGQSFYKALDGTVFSERPDYFIIANATFANTLLEDLTFQ